MRRVLRPIRLATVGTCLLLVLGVVAAPSAAGAGAGTTSRPWMDRSLKPQARAERLLPAMTLEENVGQMTQAERGQSAPTRRWSPPGGWGRCCRAAARPRPRTPRGLGRHGRRVPGPGPADAPRHPAHLRRRLRPRPRQPGRGDRVPPQHRARRDPRPPAGRAGRAPDR